MNKLLLAALLGFALIAVTAGDEDNNSANSLQAVEAELEQLRQVREADPRKKGNKPGKRKGKKGNKPGKGKGKKGKRGKTGKKGKQGRKARKGKGNKGKKARKGKKSKKARKGKGNKGKKARKGKKSKKARKVKPGKKARNGKKKLKNMVERKERQRTADRELTCETMAYCLTNMTKYTNQLKEKYSNFIRQYTRVSKFKKLNTNKGGKKGAFKSLASKIVEAGGGNSSDLKCQSSGTSSGATLMKEVAKALTSCENDIHEACAKNAPTINQTALDECKTVMDNFNTAAETCIKKTDATKCTCWTGEDLAMKSKALANCDLKSTMASLTTAKKKCTSAFAACRQMEDKGNKVIYICDSSQATSKLVEKLVNLGANKKLVEAIIKLIESATRSYRVARATTCAGFAKPASAFAKKVLGAPASPKISEEYKKVPTTNPCSKDDATLKAALGELKTAKTGIETLEADIQQELKDQTGTTASAAAVSAAASAVTTVSSAGRRNIKNMFLNFA